MNDDALSGTVDVTITNRGGERQISVCIRGLPGWLLSMMRDAGPLEHTGATYDSQREEGPRSISLSAAKVFIASNSVPGCVACGAKGTLLHVDTHRCPNCEPES